MNTHGRVGVHHRVLLTAREDVLYGPVVCLRLLIFPLVVTPLPSAAAIILCRQCYRHSLSSPAWISGAAVARYRRWLPRPALSHPCCTTRIALTKTITPSDSVVNIIVTGVWFRMSCTVGWDTQPPVTEHSGPGVAQLSSEAFFHYLTPPHFAVRDRSGKRIKRNGL